MKIKTEEKKRFRLLPTFAGVFRGGGGWLRKKKRTHASFNNSSNSTSEESLRNGVTTKIYIKRFFPFSKCQEPVRRERP